MEKSDKQIADKPKISLPKKAPDIVGVRLAPPKKPPPTHAIKVLKRLQTV